MMAFRAARNPVQHEVRGGHLDDHARRGVEGVLARPEGPFPDALFALVDALAVAEVLARSVVALLAEEADDHAHVADGHDALGDHLDGGEPAVDEIGAVDDRHVLHTAAAAGAEEGLDVLVVVVKVGLVLVGAHRGRDQLARRQCGAFMHGDDADLVRLAGDDHRAEAIYLAELLLPFLQALGVFEREDAVLENHVEEGDVDGIDAFAEDAALPPFLPAVGEEFAGVLEIVAIDDFAQRLRRLKLLATAGEDIADAALLDGDKRELVDGILPAPEAEVDAAAEDVGLVAGLAVQGDHGPFLQRTAGGPELLHDADAVVGDVTAGEPEEHQQAKQNCSADESNDHQGIKDFCQVEHCHSLSKPANCVNSRGAVILVYFADPWVQDGWKNLHLSILAFFPRKTRFFRDRIDSGASQDRPKSSQGPLRPGSGWRQDHVAWLGSAYLESQLPLPITNHKLLLVLISVN